MSDVWSSSMWASESRDVLFEMIIKTLDRTCLIKVIGRADKAMLMYNYIQGMIAASDTGGTINLKILGQKEA
ncbi:hypothetical protein SERLA73DRAFT_180936 [Serpula lacrymans var. lacrymans S7.3]|uniref:Uncharacterized protein n=2 Tax=Serpula lacrymans var. lacrymans TaxID=341189 RepID=F8PWN7_SERL3|nr:uncharacterized protein SERLADRAFT_466762 [Serpula lacrymans var. lacrymans S7.9]EGO00361.1 hypothetical protein SERLA73DRAFT_180936 [Serpula lacrymans var. lacrymans S7.3]EGO25921.1 hypothetical protein SERLADRAFT_466762 [Serpula lacrymans var. lacrymans S7.9]